MDVSSSEIVEGAEKNDIAHFPRSKRPLTLSLCFVDFYDDFIVYDVIITIQSCQGEAW